MACRPDGRPLGAGREQAGAAPAVRGADHDGGYGQAVRAGPECASAAVARASAISAEAAGPRAGQEPLRRQPAPAARPPRAGQSAGPEARSSRGSPAVAGAAPVGWPWRACGLVPGTASEPTVSVSVTAAPGLPGSW